MILITMAGLSSRFSRAGYQLPKYMLELDGKSLFEWSVSSFKKYFKTEDFTFVIRSSDEIRTYVEAKIKLLGILKYNIIELSNDTSGQAETAYLALKNNIIDFSIIIFNIDTIRYDYIKPDFIDECDGYLEVFYDEGEHWSFIDPGVDGLVLRTTEKLKISNLCSDGLYYFKSQKEFCRIFEEALNSNELVNNEFYIAPLYNKLIEKGKIIKYYEISSRYLDFSGTPVEYENLLKKMGSR
ncbi:glycosyltransferase family 2 protein [Acinetobacter sp. GXMZU3951]